MCVIKSKALKDRDKHDIKGHYNMHKCFCFELANWDEDTLYKVVAYDI